MLPSHALRLEYPNKNLRVLDGDQTWTRRVLDRYGAVLEKPMEISHHKGIYIIALLSVYDRVYIRQGRYRDPLKHLFERQRRPPRSARKSMDLFIYSVDPLKHLLRGDHTNVVSTPSPFHSNPIHSNSESLSRNLFLSHPGNSLEDGTLIYIHVNILIRNWSNNNVSGGMIPSHIMVSSTSKEKLSTLKPRSKKENKRTSQEPAPKNPSRVSPPA